jgi:hypothetical protein
VVLKSRKKSLNNKEETTKTRAKERKSTENHKRGIGPIKK